MSTALQCQAFIKAALEEIGLWVRGMYLVLLFTPAICSAPLVFALELGGEAWRSTWMDLVLWTIERAGEVLCQLSNSLEMLLCCHGKVRCQTFPA